MWELEELASDALEKTLQHLEIITPTSAEFTAKEVTDFTRDWTEAGVVILDHLHYLHWADQTENVALRNACAELRDFVNLKEVPLIALSHLRKTSTKDQSVVPTLEELHGSSEISKRANSVITFARAKSAKALSGIERNLPSGSTFVRVNKARLGADGCIDYTALLSFDLATHAYKERYHPFAIDRWATGATPVGIEHFRPWMRSAKEFV